MPESRRGRPRKLSGEKLSELKTIALSESTSLRELARRFGVSHMTIWRSLGAPVIESKGGDWDDGT